MSSIDAPIPEIPLKKPERRLLMAFMEIMGEKPYGKITVSEVCKRANVRRPAFYNYYASIAELFEMAFEYLVDTFDECFGGPLFEQPFFSDESISRYFRMIKARPQPMLMLANNYDLLVTDDVYRKYEAKAAQAFAEAGIVDETARAYLLTFFFSGFVRGIAIKWVQGGCAESIDYMVQVVRQCFSFEPWR